MEKDKWIEDVLNSTQNMGRVTPRESLLEAIEHKARAEKKDAKTVWMVAASVAVLLAVNVAVIGYYSQNYDIQTVTEDKDNPFISNNQLY
ncbi:hypothetical protein ACLI09_05295 [Flavobacterium sp. RHBU_24]|uniref:hypothetical protein n=1 Tax=Flavobacterium sp. RHBU_24 TaxID=3391185 RepID=UPI0039855326